MNRTGRDGGVERMYYDQGEYEIQCEWGLSGMTNLAALSDVVVIVDVLSFSTCVDVAVGRGAVVYPYRWRDEGVEELARSIGGVVAGRRRGEGLGLSPASLMGIEAGTKLVLPSPNGATLSLATGERATFAGCLRNAEAVAAAVGKVGKRVLVVPAGERWTDGSLRFAIEDWIGAGAIIAGLVGARSPEAGMAVSAYEAARGRMLEVLEGCSSGRELIERGFGEDVRLASMLNCSGSAPRLVGGGYQGAG